jgi:general secretion pathway protein D
MTTTMFRRCRTSRLAATPAMRATALVCALASGLGGVPGLPAAGVAHAQAPGAAPQASPRASRGLVTLNFVNADVEAVARAIAAMIDRPILVDPRVRGPVTVYSEQPQSVAQAFANFQAVLRGMNWALIESAGLLRIVPEADAKLQTGTVSVGEVGVKGDQVITQIFPLRFENPNNLVAVLRPLISANNTINANPGNNALVITDFADNLRRIARIVAALDQPANTDIEVVPLQHAVAADLAPLVQRLAEGGQGPVVGAPGVGSGASTVIADSRSNTLIVRAANPARLAALRTTIERLDRPSNLVGSGGSLWVVHLKHADATRLATVLRAAFASVGVGGSGAGGGGASIATLPVAPGATQAPSAGGAAGANAPVSGAAAVSTGGFVQADPATNSLIITAPEPLYRQVRAMIDQLDTRRAQIFIEALVVEVSGSDAADFGIQWQGLSGQSGDQFGVAGGTNFSGPGRPSIISINAGAAQGQINLGEGLNLGLLRSFNGVVSLAAIARMLQSQASTNIVSTPTLIGLDNDEAKIVVGENVPFITGQFTNTGAGGGGGGSSVNPFQTIERKDVGITLRVRPSVGEGGSIRMQIFLEQSSVLATTAAGTTNAGPSTTKRLFENNAIVEDGQILVLGGLIEDRFVVNRSKVPLLGDIPVLGALFRSESRERRRSNLMVFLRPIVMRDAEAAGRLSIDRYDAIRGRQERAQPAPSILLPINDAPQMPAAPASAAARSQPLGQPPQGAPTEPSRAP